ncbi:sensor histidine kinase [Pedobacter sp. N23S346]|uniref:sensor histidine kinase n=1 Tax=Pedobacter sp. N23S346 TaxID=3402750 RepID=UPI003ACBD9C2
MKKLFLIPVLLLVCLFVAAQQQLPLNEDRYVDSLQNVINSNKHDSLRAEASFTLVYYWKVRDTVKSKTYLAKGRKLAGNSPYLKALTLFYEGQYYSAQNPKKAAVFFKKAEESLAPIHTKNAYLKRASAWFFYALMEKDTKGYEFITRITLDHVIPLANKSGDMEDIAHYYGQLSTVLMNNYQFAKAAEYAQKAIGILEKHAPKSSSLVISYLSGVSIYCYDNQSPKAKKLLEKAHQLLLPFPASVNYPLYYYNEALYYTTIQSYSAALASIDKGIGMAKRLKQTQLYQQFIFREYDIYKQQKAYAKAKNLLLDVISEGTLVANINDKATIYGELASINGYLKDYKQAYEWLQKAKVITDSINGSQTKLKINELEARFRKAEDRQRIAALQSQAKQALLKAKNGNLMMWLLGMGCLLIIIVLLSLLIYSRYKRKLSEQREINFAQKLEEMEQREKLKVTEAMLDGEELERERVARDLHDGLGGMLAGVKIGLSGWKNNTPEVSNDHELLRVIGQLDSSVTELRRIARNMVPETLLDFGLEVALKDLCEFYMRADLKINFEAFNIKSDIAIAVQLHIYRIAQELLSNAIKHAQASSIILQCSQDNSIFLITIEDNGIGFDRAMQEKSKGMGLKSIMNRVNFFNGNLEIQSEKGEGTTINIELKIDAKR